jgi:hypothetical protein
LREGGNLEAPTDFLINFKLYALSEYYSRRKTCLKMGYGLELRVNATLNRKQSP